MAPPRNKAKKASDNKKNKSKRKNNNMKDRKKSFQHNKVSWFVFFSCQKFHNAFGLFHKTGQKSSSTFRGV